MKAFGWRWLAGLACAAAGAWAAWRLHGAPRLGVDDANIFFVYAEHLARGAGLVYNAGGERVEGVTSLLWTLLCAAAFALARRPEALLLALSVLLTATAQAALLMILRRGRRDAGRGAAPDLFEWAYLILVFASPAYVTWTTIALMDTALWGALLAVALALARPAATRGRQAAAGAVLCLLLPARPESLLAAPALLALLLARTAAEAGPRAAWRAGWRLGLALALTAAALTVFRLAYFGYPLPNTYYAKVSPSLAYNLREGLRYFRRFMEESRIAAAGLAVALLAVGTRAYAQTAAALRAGRWRRLWAFAPSDLEATAWLALLLLALPVLTGGDHFAMARFYQPAYPLLCLLLTQAARACAPPPAPAAAAAGAERVGWRRAGAAAAALLALGPLAWWAKAFGNEPNWAALAAGSPIQHEFRIAENGLALGRAAQTLFADRAPLPALGAIAAGGVKRGYAGPVVDLMGLNDTRFGHGPGDRTGMKNHAAFEKATFFRILPEMVWARPATPPATVSRDDLILKGLLSDERFRSLYTYTEITAATNGAPSLCLYFRNDFLAELLQSGRYRRTPEAGGP